MDFSSLSSEIQNEHETVILPTLSVVNVSEVVGCLLLGVFYKSSIVYDFTYIVFVFQKMCQLNAEQYSTASREQLRYVP